MKSKSIILTFTLVVSSCGSLLENKVGCGMNDKLNPEVVYYSVDDALKTLNDFLTITEGTKTDVGHCRTIESIERYTGETRPVRSIIGEVNNEETENTKAYLVNFSNNEGFAVLGANSQFPTIVAIVDGGHINNDLTVTLPRDSSIVAETTANMSDFSHWSEEDDDYYAYGVTKADREKMIYSMMKNPFLDNNTIRTILDFSYYSGGPLITYNWSQEYPFNKYCYDKNGNCVATGCSNTALSMILAYNEYPKNLYVNGKKIDWANMRKFPDRIYGIASHASHYDDEFSLVYFPETDRKLELNNNLFEQFYQFDYLYYEKHYGVGIYYKDYYKNRTKAFNDIGLLMGGVLNNVNPTFNRKGTGITNRQIELIMKNKFGYRDVKRINSSNFTNEMVSTISEMLKNGKPVFMSANPNDNSGGHSWVVDGAYYAVAGYLLHFNFGWGGDCNGYFCRECLNPTKAAEYDDKSIQNSTINGYNHTYNRGICLITYNIGIDTTPVNINY